MPDEPRRSRRKSYSPWVSSFSIDAQRVGKIQRGYARWLGKFALGALTAGMVIPLAFWVAHLDSEYMAPVIGCALLMLAAGLAIAFGAMASAIDFGRMPGTVRVDGDLL